jgi:nitrite reductase/ring-hydroxylating ferredoxin subunit
LVLWANWATSSRKYKRRITHRLRAVNGRTQELTVVANLHNAGISIRDGSVAVRENVKTMLTWAGNYIPNTARITVNTVPNSREGNPVRT